MTEQLPNLDVIIPVLNGGKTIGAAIDSALNQVGVKVREIVVDSGCSDDTIEIVTHLNDPRIHLILGNVISGKETLMSGEARNLGIDASASAWIGLLDADDIWPCDRSHQLLKAISDPDNEISMGHMIMFPDGVHVDPSRKWKLTGSYLAPLPGGGPLIKIRFLTESGVSTSTCGSVSSLIGWCAPAVLESER